MINQSLAYRFGSCIGLAAKALLHAKRPAARWAKRAVVAGILMWVFIANFSWIMSSLMTVGCFGLMLVAIVKGDGAGVSGSEDTSDDEGYRHGYQGYGYYYSNGSRRDL